MVTLEQADAQDAKAKQKQREDALFETLRMEHPELTDGSIGMIRSAIGDREVTPQSIERAMVLYRDVLGTRSPEDIQKEQTETVAKVLRSSRRRVFTAR